MAKSNFYVLVEDEPGHYDWPNLIMPDGEKGVPVFTSEAKALAFQAGDSRLTRYQLDRPPFSHLLNMLRDCMTQGVRYVACDPPPIGDGGRAHTRYDLIIKFLAAAEASGRKGG